MELYTVSVDSEQKLYAVACAARQKTMPAIRHQVVLITAPAGYWASIEGLDRTFKIWPAKDWCDHYVGGVRRIETSEILKAAGKGSVVVLSAMSSRCSKDRTGKLSVEIVTKPGVFFHPKNVAIAKALLYMEDICKPEERWEPTDILTVIRDPLDLANCLAKSRDLLH